MGQFVSHEASKCHKDSVRKVVTVLANDVAKTAIIDSAWMKILSNVRFLACRSLRSQCGDETDSNFTLLNFREDPLISPWNKAILQPICKIRFLK